MQQETYTNDIPLACTLTTTQLAARKLEVDDLLKHAQEIKELADGYALRFAGDQTWANQLTQFITFERQCCPFFTFALHFEPRQGPIWLHLRGPDGVKAIIEGMLDCYRS
jgi:hypothetical protein